MFMHTQSQTQAHTQYRYLEKWSELSEQCRHHHHVQLAFKIHYRDRIEIDCPAFVCALMSVSVSVV